MLPFHKFLCKSFGNVWDVFSSVNPAVWGWTNHLNVDAGICAPIVSKYYGGGAGAGGAGGDDDEEEAHDEL